jgi:hypothetical protein
MQVTSSVEINLGGYVMSQEISLVTLIPSVLETANVYNTTEHLLTHSPEENNTYLKTVICQMQRKQGCQKEIIFIKPNSLYITMPCECRPVPRIFLGSYLLNPIQMLPSHEEMKEEMKWLRVQGRLVNRTPSTWFKDYDVDDLYEDYLTDVLARMYQYAIDLDMYVEYGSDFFDSVGFLPAVLKGVFLSERAKYKALRDQYEEYKIEYSQQNSVIPKWICQRALNDFLSQSQLIRVINQVF